MFIKIIKPIPVSPEELLEVGGIYKVTAIQKGNYIVVGETNRSVCIKKDEAQEIGNKLIFTYEQAARCLKYLEMYKWRRYSEDTSPESKYLDKIVCCAKFYCSSPFCSFFRKKVIKTGDGVKNCYCPMKPYDHHKWPLNEKGRRKCNKEIGKDGIAHHRAEQDLYNDVAAIPIKELVQFLKKVEPDYHQKQLLYKLWFKHIWFRERKVK